jgi:hypothetical protein
MPNTKVTPHEISYTAAILTGSTRLQWQPKCQVYCRCHRQAEPQRTIKAQWSVPMGQVQSWASAAALLSGLDLRTPPALAMVQPAIRTAAQWKASGLDDHENNNQ